MCVCACACACACVCVCVCPILYYENNTCRAYDGILEQQLEGSECEVLNRILVHTHQIGPIGNNTSKKGMHYISTYIYTLVF